MQMTETDVMVKTMGTETKQSFKETAIAAQFGKPTSVQGLDEAIKNDMEAVKLSTEATTDKTLCTFPEVNPVTYKHGSGKNDNHLGKKIGEKLASKVNGGLREKSSGNPTGAKVMGTRKEISNEKDEGQVCRVSKVGGKNPARVAQPEPLLDGGSSDFEFGDSDDVRSQQKKVTTTESNSACDDGRVNFDSFYETVRKTTARFPLGVSVQRLLHHVNNKRNFGRTWELFPGKSDMQVVNIFAELFIKDSLPGRETELLFPSTMPMIALSAVEIVEGVWNKMVFIVRFRGGPLGAMRDFDMSHFYEELWKVRVDIEDWGFNGYPEFVDWAMTQWNGNGKEDGLTVKEFGSRPIGGNTTVEEPTFLLYFKPRSV